MSNSPPSLTLITDAQKTPEIKTHKSHKKEDIKTKKVFKDQSTTPSNTSGPLNRTIHAKTEEPSVQKVAKSRFSWKALLHPLDLFRSKKEVVKLDIPLIDNLCKVTERNREELKDQNEAMFNKMKLGHDSTIAQKELNNDISIIPNELDPEITVKEHSSDEYKKVRDDNGLQELTEEYPMPETNAEMTPAKVNENLSLAARGYKAMWNQINTLEGLIHDYFGRMETNNDHITTLDRLRQKLNQPGEINWKDFEKLMNEAVGLGLIAPDKEVLGQEDKERLMKNIDTLKDSYVGMNEQAQLRLQMYQNSLKFLYECLSNFDKFFHDIKETFARNIATR